jgi:hypothetical protein
MESDGRPSERDVRALIRKCLPFFTFANIEIDVDHIANGDTWARNATLSSTLTPSIHSISSSLVPVVGSFHVGFECLAHCRNDAWQITMREDWFLVGNRKFSTVAPSVV